MLTGGVARLELESIEEEVEEDGVSGGAVGVRAGGGVEAVGVDEADVDVVEEVGPDFTDVVHEGGAGDVAVSQRVHSPGCERR